MLLIFRSLEGISVDAIGQGKIILRISILLERKGWKRINFNSKRIANVRDNFFRVSLVFQLASPESWEGQSTQRYSQSLHITSAGLQLLHQRRCLLDTWLVRHQGLLGSCPEGGLWLWLWRNGQGKSFCLLSQLWEFLGFRCFRPATLPHPLPMPEEQESKAMSTIFLPGLGSFTARAQRRYGIVGHTGQENTNVKLERSHERKP